MFDDDDDDDEEEEEEEEDEEQHDEEEENEKTNWNPCKSLKACLQQKYCQHWSKE